MPVPEGARKRCLVVVDGRCGPLLRELQLPANATIAQALSELRTQLDAGPWDLAIDWDGGAVGVWGVRCGRQMIPGDGDRIELYRPLPDDPRQRRRQRVRADRS